jgi:hypothetical protein
MSNFLEDTCSMLLDFSIEILSLPIGKMLCVIIFLKMLNTVKHFYLKCKWMTDRVDTVLLFCKFSWQLKRATYSVLMLQNEFTRT